MRSRSREGRRDPAARLHGTPGPLRRSPSSPRTTIAVCAIIVSAVLSLWGIIGLIAKGYGTMAWGFFAVYVVPLATIGLYRIIKSGQKETSK